MSVRRALGRRSSVGGVASKHYPTLVADVLIPAIHKANTQSILHTITASFNRQLVTVLQEAHRQSGPFSLKHFTSFALFSSSMTAIFGESFPIDIYDDTMLVDRDAYFLFTPPLSFFAFSAHRAQSRIQTRLLNYMSPWIDTHGNQDIDGVSIHGNDVLRGLTSSQMPLRDQAGALQAYIWAIYTNISNLSFWLFAHLLADPTSYERLQEEVDHGVKTEFMDAGKTLIDGAHPGVIGGPSFRLLGSAVKEIGRLYMLPASYRTANADVVFPSTGASDEPETFWARKGDIVVANITGMHWDEQWFEDPLSFRVDRFFDVTAEQKRYLSIFGRGTYTVRDLDYLPMRSDRR